MADLLTEIFGTTYGPIVLILVRIGGMVAVAIVILKLVNAASKRLRSLVVEGDGSKLNRAEQRAETLGHVVRSVSRIAVFVLLGLTIVSEFGVDIGPVLTGAGIIGLAVGFGAQSLVKDVISGFFIFFEDQFGVGDIVRIGDLSGTVEGMTLRVTVLRNLQGQVHVIPNGNIQTVTVLTKEWSRALVDVDVAYRENLDRVFGIVDRLGTRLAAEWADKILERPVILGVEKRGDYGVTIRIIVKTHPGKHDEVAREFRKRIKEEFDREGVEIPSSQRAVWMVDRTPL